MDYILFTDIYVYVHDVTESQYPILIAYDFFDYAIFFAPMKVINTLFDD